jgi:replication factor A1
MNSGLTTLINDLKPSHKDIHVNFQVIEQISEKEIRKGANTTHRVANFKVADQTGSVRLCLWNEEISKITIGKTYELNNGYVNIFQEYIQLATGKNGEIKPIDVKFEKLNQENDKSKQKVKFQRKKPTKGSNRFRKKKSSEREDNFSAETNKKFLWAERR